jgi:dolichol-phosphate mannosyltransferase
MEGTKMACRLEGNVGVDSKVGVILPTYCEAQNIQRIIAEIQALPLNVTILVIDDSSPDGTAKAVKSLQANSPNLLLLVRPQKSGLGSAITDGFRVFLSLRNVPEFIVTMDADYSHNPSELPRIVSNMKDGCDLVIGSRYCASGKTEGWPYTRKIISRAANAIARGVLGLKLHDCTSGYRCYSTSFLSKTIEFLNSQTYDIQIETVKQAHSQGFQIREVPILFVNRKQGKSKLSIVEIENYVSYIFKTVAIRKIP